MAAFFWYASFPNSRIKPRPSTSRAETYQVQIADTTQPLTKIVDVDLNRTYVIVKNLSLSTSLWYIYAAETVVDPSVVATFGSTEQLLYQVSTNTLFEKQDEGTTINWVPVNIEDVGESIQPLQSASLESPENYWAAADSAVAVIPAVKVGIDKGSG